MEFELLNVAAVVVAQHHNPSILHPSFLASEKIVPDNWEGAEPPLCTPAVSVVKYTNGIVFTVEQSKLQIVDNNPTPGAIPSRVGELAIKYIKKLPYVRYTATGVNMTGFMPCAVPEEVLIRQFLKTGTWNTDPLKPVALGIRLKYPVEQGVLNLSCDPGNVVRGESAGEVKSILVNANYHTDLPEDKRQEYAEDALSRFQQHYEHCMETVRTVFELEN